MKKMIIILLMMVLPLGLISSENERNKEETTLQQGKWVQLYDWNQTYPNCAYNCISIWYTLWRYSTPDPYGYYHYTYTFQSNSKWNNGNLANTGMYGTIIYFDNVQVAYLNYGIAGYKSDTQLGIGFKIHKSYIKANSVARLTKKETYLN